MEVTQRRRGDMAMHRISRLVSTLNLPLAGRRFLPMYAVLYHRGRRSGKRYSVPVFAAATADGLLVPMMFEERTQWARNVLAAGGCTLRWRGEDRLLTEPEIVGAEAAVASFSRIQRWGLRTRGVQRYMRLRPIVEYEGEDEGWMAR